jgi:hypothetical protein
VAFRELYSTSDPFMDTVRAAAVYVDITLEQPIRLARIVTLPDFGQRVILQFALSESGISSFAEADALEVRLRKLVGEDFWATLETGLPGPEGEQRTKRLERIEQALPASVVRFQSTSHSSEIGRDGRIVLAALELPDTCTVYMIELPVADPSLLPTIRIADTKDPGYGPSEQYALDPVRFGEIKYVPEVLKFNRSYSGYVKAYTASVRRHMALDSLIAQFE